MFSFFYFLFSSLFSYISSIFYLNISYKQVLERNGYIMFILEEEYMKYIDECSKHAHNFGNQRNWHLINIECYRKLLLHPKIINILNELYGLENCHLTSFSTNTLYPNCNDIYWHVDHPYKKNDCKDDKFDPRSIQINISLDDFTEENGSTQYLKYSHKNHSSESEKGIFLCKKGTVMVYVGNLWHTAGINKTNIPRSVLLSNFAKLQYEALEMRDKNDKNIDKQVNDNDTDFKVVNGKVLLR